MFKSSIFILMFLFSTNLYAHVMPGQVHIHPHGSDGYSTILFLVALIISVVGVVIFQRVRKGDF